jgi:hypothetical protein
VAENDPGWGKNNYRGNAGNDTGQWFENLNTEQNNGMFVTNHAVQLQEVTDGTAHTALFSEMILGDGDDDHIDMPGDYFQIASTNTTAAEICTACTSVSPESGAASQFSRSGRNWCEGNYAVTRYTHILTPNMQSCVRAQGNAATLGSSANNQGGAITASSRHAGGVNLVMVDASLQFVSNGVDPAVWSALGSRAGAELVSWPW